MALDLETTRPEKEKTQKKNSVVYFVIGPTHLVPGFDLKQNQMS